MMSNFNTLTVLVGKGWLIISGTHVHIKSKHCFSIDSVKNFTIFYTTPSQFTNTPH